MSTYLITDIAKAIDNKSKIKIIGIRPGEKMHEELITYSDSFNTIESNKFYIILPKVENITKYVKKFRTKKINKPFSYNSKNDQNILSVNEIRNLIKKIKIS